MTTHPTLDQPIGPPTSCGSTERHDSADDLAGRLELTFRLLGKRIYLPGLRVLREASSGGPGVDKASYPLLALLEEHGDVRPSDAALALELDLSTVSRQVRHLEQSGLIVRRPDDEDGRACRVRLTPAGRSGLAAVRRLRGELLDTVVGSWPAADRAELVHLLDRLHAGLRDLPPHPPLSPHLTSALEPTTEISP